jgi:hypothetical protein
MATAAGQRNDYQRRIMAARPHAAPGNRRVTDPGMRTANVQAKPLEFSRHHTAIFNGQRANRSKKQMNTATIEPAETKANNHGIELPERFAPSNGNKAALDALSKRQEKHAVAVDTWRDSVQKTVDDAMQLRVRELDEGGALQKRAGKIREQHGELQTSKLSIAWQRYEIRPRLEPDVRRAVERQRAICERVTTDEIKRLVESRVADGLPAAGGNNSEALEIQLRRKAEEAEYCLIGRGALNRAETALQQFQTRMNICPRPGECTIAWPAFAGFSETIAGILGLDGTAPPVEPRQGFIERLLSLAAAAGPRERLARNFDRLKCERILWHMGLKDAALLPQHEAIIEQLAELVTVDASDPLSTVADAERVHKLVAQLPPTPEVRSFVGSRIAIIEREN